MIRVSCAVLMNEMGEVLVTRRSSLMSQLLKWEFPGGKLEEGETPEEAILREIKEELNLDITITGKLRHSVYRYGAKEICLIPFTGKIRTGALQLKEHDAFAWLEPKLLRGLDWAEADIPVMEELILLSQCRKPEPGQ